MIGENEDANIWEEHLFHAITNISDNKFQNRTWLGRDPKYISSFSEVISVLYDDFDFERYIEYYESITGKENKLYVLFLELHQMIEGYQAPETDEQVLADSKWREITDKGKEIVFFWPTAMNGISKL